MHFRLTGIIILNPQKMQQKALKALPLCHSRSTSRSIGHCSGWSLATRKKSGLGCSHETSHSPDVLTWLCMKADFTLWPHSSGNSSNDRVGHRCLVSGPTLPWGGPWSPTVNIGVFINGGSRGWFRAWTFMQGTLIKTQQNKTNKQQQPQKNPKPKQEKHKPTNQHFDGNLSFSQGLQISPTWELCIGRFTHKNDLAENKL